MRAFRSSLPDPYVTQHAASVCVAARATRTDVSARWSLPDPYVGQDGVDFICSQEGHDGMTHCHEHVPLWIENGVPCNGSQPAAATAQLSQPGAADAAAAADPTSATLISSCVNWNQYYTVCKTGLSNPYRGSISFDNIGLAWVAIFQVTAVSSLMDPHTHV